MTRLGDQQAFHNPSDGGGVSRGAGVMVKRSRSEPLQAIKRTLLAALLALIGSPAMACTTSSSGYLQVNGQLQCIRQLSDAEIRGNQIAAVKAQARKNLRKAQMSANALRRHMDSGRKNPGKYWTRWIVN